MSRRTLYGLGAAIISILSITIGLGQGCAGGSSIPGLEGFKSGSGPLSYNAQLPDLGQIIGPGGMRGNGGGYGGMVSNNEGQYGSGSPMAAQAAEQSSHSSRRHRRHALSGDGKGVYFFVQERTGSCRTLSSGWQPLDNYISGYITLAGSFVLTSPSLCGDLDVKPLSSVSIVDFNTKIAVYGNRVYEHFDMHPPALAALHETVAYCRSAISKFSVGSREIDLGADVRIYTDGTKLAGELVIGREVGGKPTKLTVRAFEVSELNQASELKFTAEGLELALPVSGVSPSVGTLHVNLDGEALTIPMERCWR